MPCFLGFHPYFSHPSIIDYCKLEFFPKKRYQLDNMIPNGELVDFTHENEPLGSTHYDDCFLIDTQDDGLTAVLTDTAHNVSTYIYTSDNVSHLQIYTPQGRHSIAIEPQLAPANIFNLLPDSKSLSPLATLSFWCKISAKLI